MPPIRPNSSHMMYIFGAKTDAATDNAAMMPPTIPIGRQPHLLQRAEASGAAINESRTETYAFDRR
jgi:hypothetical protein